MRFPITGPTRQSRKLLAISRNYWKEIHGCRDYEELRNWFLEKTAHVCQGMATTKEKESESVVAKARNYIAEIIGITVPAHAADFFNTVLLVL